MAQSVLSDSFFFRCMIGNRSFLSQAHNSQVIVKSKDFLSAVQKMQRALFEFYIRGIKTNISFLDNVLKHPEFLSGKATTSFIQRNPELFVMGNRSTGEASKLLDYLANLVSFFI